MNIAKMMKQAQKMQADMQRVQEELSQRVYRAEAAGGLISAEATGAGDLRALTIHPDLIKDATTDPEMLQDLVITVVREAVEKGRAEAQQEMSKLTAGLNIPGLG